MIRNGRMTRRMPRMIGSTKALRPSTKPPRKAKTFQTQTLETCLRHQPGMAAKRRKQSKIPAQSNHDFLCHQRSLEQPQRQQTCLEWELHPHIARLLSPKTRRANFELPYLEKTKRTYKVQVCYCPAKQASPMTRLRSFSELQLSAVG